MSTINIRRDVTDPFYRYKMESLQSKIEGKGNGIKTVIVNLSSVAQSLARPPAYVIKYFGFELGAQTNTNPTDDRWIINGAHEAGKLQDHLDGFISKYVLCKKCKNPETEIHIKDGHILLDCKACGQRSDVDLRLKLSSFIVKNQTTKKGKRDKKDRRAEKKAKKGAEADDNADNVSNGSHHESNSDHNDDANGEVEIEAGSDDEFTNRITAGAREIDDSEPKEIQWSVDTSEEAVKARARELASALTLNGDDEEAGDEEGNVYDQFGSWIIKTAEEKGGVNKLGDVEIYLKAKDMGIETKYKTLTVLAQTLFDDNIVKEIEPRAPMLKKMITSEKHEKAFLGGTERFVGKDKPNLIPQISAILMKFYDNDLISEDVLKGWGRKASKKYVDLSTSKKVRKSSEQFITWLENAESDDSEEDE